MARSALGIKVLKGALPDWVKHSGSGSGDGYGDGYGYGSGDGYGYGSGYGYGYGSGYGSGDGYGYGSGYGSGSGYGYGYGDGSGYGDGYGYGYGSGYGKDIPQPYAVAYFEKTQKVEKSADGRLVLFKSVRHGDRTDFRTGKIKYEGKVEAPDWDPDPSRECGGGLHVSPTPDQALGYSPGGEVLRVAVEAADIAVYWQKMDKVRVRKLEVLNDSGT